MSEDRGPAGMKRGIDADEREPLSDVGRLLAVIAAAEDIGHPLTTAELEAACYLLSERSDGGLAFSYSFHFALRPRSEQLYEQLMALEDAQLALRASPIRIQHPRGTDWLARAEWADEAADAQQRASKGLRELLAEDADLIRLSRRHAEVA